MCIDFDVHHFGGSYFVYVNDFCYYRNCLYTHRYKFSSEKKKTGKESQYIVSRLEPGSDPPFGSDLESGCDIIHEFSFVFGWIFGKMDQNNKFCRGSFTTAKSPFTVAKVLVVAKDPHAAARLRRRVWPFSGSPQRSSASSRRSYYSQHEKCCVLVCSTIPLFQGLVYWTNEDPISV